MSKSGYNTYCNGRIIELEQQLAKSNERVRELEKCCKLHTLPPNVVFDMVEAMIPQQLNKFAIDKKIEALQEYKKFASGWGMGTRILDEMIEKLRKE